MSAGSTSTEGPAVLSRSDDQDRRAEAWELVRTARWAARQLIPSVEGAANGIMSRYEEEELPQNDRQLALAMTVMVHMLTAMQTAVEILGWIDPAVPTADGVGLLLPPGGPSSD
jgi:hypothetical protein